MFTVDNENFQIYENVKQYWFCLRSDKFNIIYHDNVKTNERTQDNKTYILLFENVYQGAFAHWFFDSAIFLQYYHKLNEKFNGKLKIFTINNPERKYKKMLFDFFDIPKENILYCHKELTHIHRLSRDNKWMSEKNITLPENNICITCPIINLNNVNFDKTNYKNRIYKFKELFYKKIDKNLPTIENLFFPRNKAQNLSVNNRKINYDRVYNTLKNKQYIEYDTMNTEKIIDQINLLVNSKNIFLDYGSSLWVNGIFCENSNIFVSNNLDQHNGDYGHCYNTLLEILKEKNNVYFIS